MKMTVDTVILCALTACMMMNLGTLFAIYKIARIEVRKRDETGRWSDLDE